MEKLVTTLTEACLILGVKRSTMYVLEATDPTFPRKIRLSARRVGFMRSELEAWLVARPRVAQPAPVVADKAA
jgi:predicted DNA-binding transcriptional regulator AlpA